MLSSHKHIALTVIGSFITFLVYAQNPNAAFGDSIPVSNGLVGRIFLLPENTSRLPDFDTMRPTSTVIYTRSIDIPDTNWSAGFPGLRDRFEWFGIEYTGAFRVLHPGKYTFRLVSDDGAKLYIDDSLLIDNDGEHASSSGKGEIMLKDSLLLHNIKLRYFQGPRYRLALQLYWTVADGKEEIFPGNNFILYTPHHSNWWWLLLLLLIGLCIFFIIWRRRRRKSMPPGENINS